MRHSERLQGPQRVCAIYLIEKDYSAVQATCRRLNFVYIGLMLKLSNSEILGETETVTTSKHTELNTKLFMGNFQAITKIIYLLITNTSLRLQQF